MGGACNSTFDCPVHSICEMGTCVVGAMLGATCASNAPCDQGLVCYQQTCHPFLEVGQGCDIDPQGCNVLEALYCQGSSMCARASYAAAGMACGVNGTAITACAAAGFCGSGSSSSSASSGTASGGTCAPRGGGRGAVRHHDRPGLHAAVGVRRGRVQAAQRGEVSVTGAGGDAARRRGYSEAASPSSLASVTSMPASGTSVPTKAHAASASGQARMTLQTVAAASTS